MGRGRWRRVEWGDFPEYLVGFLQEYQNCPHHRTFHQPLDIPFLIMISSDACSIRNTRSLIFFVAISVRFIYLVAGIPIFKRRGRRARLESIKKEGWQLFTKDTVGGETALAPAKPEANQKAWQSRSYRSPSSHRLCHRVKRACPFLML